MRAAGLLWAALWGLLLPTVSGCAALAAGGAGCALAAGPRVAAAAEPAEGVPLSLEPFPEGPGPVSPVPAGRTGLCPRRLGGDAVPERVPASGRAPGPLPFPGRRRPGPAPVTPWRVWITNVPGAWVDKGWCCFWRYVNWDAGLGGGVCLCPGFRFVHLRCHVGSCVGHLLPAHRCASLWERGSSSSAPWSSGRHRSL